MSNGDWENDERKSPRTGPSTVIPLEGPQSVVQPVDVVNHPSHYTSGKIEVWDFIMDQKLDYFAGNVVKYVCRHTRKEKPLEDLKKAKAYIEKLIKMHEQENNG
jgi:hypothetical protein